MLLNSLTKDKIPDLPKLKAYTDNNFNLVAQTVQFLFDRAENIVGKGQNDGYQHFLLFP